MSAAEQAQALPILVVIRVPKVGFDPALPIALLDLPPLNVVPNVLLVLVPLQRHVPHGVPWRHLQTAVTTSSLWPQILRQVIQSTHDSQLQQLKYSNY